MRVRSANYWWTGMSIPNACDDVMQGETEDYNVTILDNHSNLESYADQSSMIVAPGSTRQAGSADSA